MEVRGGGEYMVCLPEAANKARTICSQAETHSHWFDMATNLTFVSSVLKLCKSRRKCRFKDLLTIPKNMQ